MEQSYLTALVLAVLLIINHLNNMDNGNLQIKPQRVVVQLNDCLMAAFFSVWLDYDKPCILTVTPSGKAPGLVGIGFTVDNDKTLEFMSKVVKSTGGRLWNLTK